MKVNEQIGGGVYMCSAFRNYINALLKCGSFGGKTPAKRMGGLRKEHSNLEMICYLPLPESPKSEYESVEYHVKMIMFRRFPHLSHIGNDHFGFKTNKYEHKALVEFYCQQAMKIAIAYCDMYGIKHGEVIYPNYKKIGVRYGKRG